MLSAIVALSCSWQLCSAGTYYVKPDGDDSKDGLSVANAWKTVGRAIAKPLAAGDTLKAMPGRYYMTSYHYGSLSYGYFSNIHGAAGSPIVVESYDPANRAGSFPGRTQVLWAPGQK